MLIVRTTAATYTTRTRPISSRQGTACEGKQEESDNQLQVALLSTI